MYMPHYVRQGYWTMQNLANQFQQYKDWTMAAEAWELAIKCFRRQSRGQLDPGTAARFYTSCAQAYVQLNDKDKALDSYHRAMSVISRTDSNYQEILNSALKEV